MPGLSSYLAAIQGMHHRQIVARLHLRARRLVREQARRLPLRAPRPIPLPTATSAFSREWGVLGGAAASPAARWETPTAVNVRNASPWALDALLRQAEGVAAGQFRFLNHDQPWRLPVDWEARGQTRLWRFHLHYFDDAPALMIAGHITGETRFVRTFCDLAVDWIAQNPVGVGDGWHPYPLSRRIPNWFYALALSEPDEVPEHALLLASLRTQAGFLARNLEFDALGNHLLANLRALLFAATCFADREREAQQWWKTAARHLEAQVAEQFLADGGHFERSPMYHALVLQDLLECAALYRCRGTIPLWLQQTIRRATTWLQQMCHPDGGVALFNDATVDGPDYTELAAFSEALLGDEPDLGTGGWRQWMWPGRSSPTPRPAGCAVPGSAAPSTAPDVERLTALPESGYFVLRDPDAGHALFFDAGEPCPSHIPAHAHADLLSFELSIAGRRVIVDSGVCEYAAGPWRDYCRSTRAHNTLQIDGADQSEVWGSFRLGRRAHPVDAQWQSVANTAEVSASHNGYGRLRGGVLHRRTVRYDGAAFRVEDTVSGAGYHRIESFLHFHPAMQVDLQSGGLAAVGQGVHLRIRFIGPVQAESHSATGDDAVPLQGWYCPEFGLRQPNAVIVLKWEGNLPIEMGYTVEPIRATSAP